MKRKWILLICLAAAVLCLSSCAKEKTVEEFPVIQQNVFPVAGNETQNAQTYIEEQPDQYDEPDSDELYAEAAMTEEEFDDSDLYPAEAAEEEMPSYYNDPLTAGTTYPYAGATPIPIDPVDMPTPTPRSPISFTYSEYASRLGITFKAPEGWIMDETQDQLCILTDPIIRDGVQATITISVEPVSNKYSQSELKSHVKQRLTLLKNSDMDNFNQTNTATKKMLGAGAVYANYNGTTFDGLEVGGRIMYVTVDKTLYGLEIMYPYGFKNSFENAFNEVRSSLEAK